MAYQQIVKPVPVYFNGDKVFGKKRDCEDFKPYFFNRRYCRWESNCKAEGYYCEGSCGILSSFPKECTGINKDKWQKIIS